jgi:hypothetical protein
LLSKNTDPDSQLHIFHLRKVRLVCRYLATVASAIIGRSVWFPVMTEVRALRLCGQEERIELQRREEGARMHAVQLLADPAIAAAVRRFSLDGVDSSDAIEAIRHTLLHTELSKGRVDFAAALLKHARGLKELRLATLALTLSQSANANT